MYKYYIFCIFIKLNNLIICIYVKKLFSFSAKYEIKQKKTGINPAQLIFIIMHIKEHFSYRQQYFEVLQIFDGYRHFCCLNLHPS